LLVRSNGLSTIEFFNPVTQTRTKIANFLKTPGMPTEKDRAHSLLVLGDPYSKKDLSEILQDATIAVVREGIYTWNKSTFLLFVDLVKKDKEDRFHFNDYFNDDYFEWDSQTTKNINSPSIREIVENKKEVLLFVRIHPKIKNITQPFFYCGRLKYVEHDPKTANPVHIVLESVDYDESNLPLQDIYAWRPANIVATSLNDQGGLPNSYKKRIYTKPNYTERKGLVTSRVGQGFYRQEVLAKWDNRCAVTGLNLPEILIASHILPWRAATKDERLEPDNGILLCPNLDALFDQHLISFDDAGLIVFSKKLNLLDLAILGINAQMKLRKIDVGMRKYLSMHRLGMQM
jgi:Domain of unknown function (DUF3427)/HNH endonuclease